MLNGTGLTKLRYKLGLILFSGVDDSGVVAKHLFSSLAAFLIEVVQHARLTTT